MKIKFSVLGFLFVISLLYCSCKNEPSAYGPAGNCSGRVLDSATSTPINQALIILTGTAGSFDTTFSNTDGLFGYGGIPMSASHIQVQLHFQKSGYQEKILNVELIGGENVNLGDIRLRP